MVLFLTVGMYSLTRGILFLLSGAQGRRDYWILQMLLGCVSPVCVDHSLVYRHWLIEPFSSSSFMYKDVYISAPWKSQSPKRVNILIWNMINSSLNCYEVPKEAPLALYFSTSLFSMSFRCGFSSAYLLLLRLLQAILV